MTVFASSIAILLWSSWLIAAATAETTCLNILITNDDGYETLFLQSLFQFLREETCHKALIAAPKENQSGKSASLPSPFEYIEIGNPKEGVYFADTTPVGAALFGLDVVGPENNFMPDLVISGPNVGHNLGYVMAVSGTVGAATAAMSRNVPTIAVSASSKDADASLEDEEKVESATMIAQLIVTLIDTKLVDEDTGNLVLAPGFGVNVNIPPVHNGSGNIDDYHYQLTTIGIANPVLGAMKFYRDMSDSPALQRLAPPGYLEGESGLSVLEFPIEDYGYSKDTNWNSEGNALGINYSDPNPEPQYVITVSPMSFTYARDPTTELKKAFAGNSKYLCKDSKTWQKTIGTKVKKCGWVGKNPSKRCKDKGDDKTKARKVCLEACCTGPCKGMCNA